MSNSFEVESDRLYRMIRLSLWLKSVVFLASDRSYMVCACSRGITAYAKTRENSQVDLR